MGKPSDSKILYIEPMSRPAIHRLLDANGAVLNNGSVVELVRFPLNSFELDDDDVTSMFRLNHARLVVDTSDSELAAI